MMKGEGVIKFDCHWNRSEPLDEELITDLNYWRSKMYELGLIGVGEDGIGYGNISVRFQNNQFIISGSGTGKIKTLTGAHYALVTNHDIPNNRLWSTGSTIASSESLTHAMLYELAADVHAVIHVHHNELWRRLLKTAPSTADDIEYGTPAMAMEIARLFKEKDLAHEKMFAMGGHHGGVMFFGKDLAEAAEILFKVYLPMQSAENTG